MCVCVCVCVCVLCMFVSAVSAEYPALLFLLIHSMLHYVSLQYWNRWANKWWWWLLLFHTSFWIWNPHILSNCPNKQSDSDPIPTWLLKECASVLVPTITNIVNFSLNSGQFQPILVTSDKDELSRYRPTSDLSVIPKARRQPTAHACYRRRQMTPTDDSVQNNTGPLNGPVIIERIVKCHLIDHLTANKLYYLILTNLPTVNIIPLKLLCSTFKKISSIQ